MKQVTISVYEYDELPDYVKQKVTESVAEELISSNFDVYSDYVVTWLQEEYGIDAEVEYSISYCQGDGFSFDTKEFLTCAVCKKLLTTVQDTEVKKLIQVLLDNQEYSIVSTVHSVRHYAYASIHDVQFDTDVIFEYLNDMTLSCDPVEVYNKFVTTVQHFYISICNDAEAMGYKQYDVSDEDVTAEANKWLYYKDGRVFGGKDE